MKWSLTLVAVGGLGALLAGCANFNGADKDLRQIREQLDQVSVDVAAMKTSLDSATEETKEAQQKSQAAESTANQALAVASQDRKAIDDLTAKIDRLGHQAHRHASVKSASSSSSTSSASAAASSARDD